MKLIWEEAGEINVKQFALKEPKEAEAQLSKLYLASYAVMARYGLRWFLTWKPILYYRYFESEWLLEP